MLNELSNDPIQAAIARLEKQHEEDKQGMLWAELVKIMLFCSMMICSLVSG
jgi:hypothetical protein